MQRFSKPFAGAFLATTLAGSAVYSGGAVPTWQTISTVAPTSAAIVPLPPSPVEIVVGFAGLLRVEGNISTIVLGDPEIADASPLDSGTILLNGQAAGTTNMIILNENGDILRNLMLHVSARQPGTVTVRRALDPQVYSCVSGLCEGGSPPSSGGVFRLPPQPRLPVRGELLQLSHQTWRHWSVARASSPASSA